ncbi:UPF0547 protein C16orf87 homolog [Saccostrea echinata]|uniref:UPF0547 protein C16orf87 homolog n=1 Tax=Saccostrea echinata TaxID=191078 RepID=UPI002A80593D|nr:UPF0547 protein C16orf87 homolog [Saccostrea echinata]
MGRRKGRGFNKMVNKKCAECEKEVPIARKFCTCGHEFVPKKSLSPSGNDSPQTKVRKTEETKRVIQKPDYFDSEVEEISSKRAKTITTNIRRRGRPKGSTNKHISSLDISKGSKMNDLLDLKRKQLELEERAVEALEKIASALEGWQQKSN